MVRASNSFFGACKHGTLQGVTARGVLKRYGGSFGCVVFWAWLLNQMILARVHCLRRQTWLGSRPSTLA